MKFRGQAYRNLDAKGRLALPPNFKDMLLEGSADGTVVLTLYERHVIGMTPRQWEITEAELGKTRHPSRKLQIMQRILWSGYEEARLDAQGRLPISVNLRKSGRLDKEVVVMGSGARFEIWSVKEYEELLSIDCDVSEELEENDIVLPFLGGGHAV